MGVVGRLRHRIAGDRSVRPFTDDEQCVVFFDVDEGPFTRRRLALKRNHLTNDIQLLPEIRVKTRPHLRPSLLG